MSIEPTTNFKDSNGTDLGTKLVTKDYLISVYPSLAPEIGISPELWVWGNATGPFLTVGGLGTNGGPTTSTPVTTFAGGSNWKYISLRGRGVATIKTDGTLWTWGNGNSSQLGNATIVDVSTPVTTFAGGTNWKQVSSGVLNVSAIKTDGTLWVWGSNASAQLGNALTVGNRSTPVTTFAGGTDWKQVNSSTNSSFTAAIKTDGTLWVWGGNLQGELGINNLNNRISTPVTTFAGGTNWKQVSTGGSHTAAIKTDGTLWVWGSNGDGQLGNGITTGNASTPITTFAGGTNWKQVSSGLSQTAAIKIDGTLWTWGSGSLGALGNLSSGVAGSSTPVTTFAGGTNWKQVSAGQNAMSAIKTDGTLWIWGSGTGGRLGTGYLLSVSQPVTTFAGGTDWKQTSTSSSLDQSSAIRSGNF